MSECFTLTGLLRCTDCGAEDTYRWTLLPPGELVMLYHPSGACNPKGVGQ